MYVNDKLYVLNMRGGALFLTRAYRATLLVNNLILVFGDLDHADFKVSPGSYDLKSPIDGWKLG